MWDKYKQVGWIAGGTLLAYVFVLAFWGFMVEMNENLAIELAARPTILSYWELVAAVHVVPWILIFVPALLGGTMIVFVLKRDGGE